MSGVSSLNTRLDALENEIKAGNTITLKKKKQDAFDLLYQRREEAIRSLEEKYLKEVREEFGVSHNYMILPSLCLYTIKFIENNAIPLSKLTAQILSGTMKLDLAVSLISSVFVDVAVEVITSVVEDKIKIFKYKNGITIEQTTIRESPEKKKKRVIARLFK